MELQGAHEAKDYELQSRGFKKTVSHANDEQQLDVLNRLGKLPVLKVSPLSWLQEAPYRADILSAISASSRSWALRVTFWSPGKLSSCKGKLAIPMKC